jgi:hypothetical protein
MVEADLIRTEKQVTESRTDFPRAGGLGRCDYDFRMW